MRRKRRGGPAWLDEDRPAIARITAAYMRHYSDEDRWTAYVEWIDDRGDSGVTEGPAKPDGTPVHPHLQSLFERAKRAGIEPKAEER